MNEHDPPPLTDPASGAPALLRDALAGARARTPSPADLARVAARLPLGAPLAAAAAPPSVLSGALLGAALGAVVSGVALFWDAPRPPLPAAPLPVVTVPVEAPAPAPAIPPLPATTLVIPRAPRPPQVSASAPAALQPVAPAAEPAPVSGGTGVTAPPGDPETEAHLLRRALDALSASPAQTLAITDEHASRYPSGALVQEREVVAIEALVRLGRTKEARARIARFVEAFPGSVHRSRIEALVAP